MKRLIVFMAVCLMGLSSLGKLYAQDDVYHSPSYNPYTGNSTTEQYSDGNGNTYVTNNYYNDYDDNGITYDDDYDYFYESRLRRFYNPYVGMSYFSGGYVDRFWYGSPAAFWGQTIYYDPFWGSGWNSPWSINIGWGWNSWNWNRWNNWNNPWAHNHWGWNGGWNNWNNPWAYNSGCGWNNPWGWGNHVTYVYYNDGPYYSNNNNNGGNGYSGNNSNTYYGPRNTHDNYGGRVTNGNGSTRPGKGTSIDNSDTGIQYTPSSTIRPTYNSSGNAQYPTSPNNNNNNNSVQPNTDNRDNVRPSYEGNTYPTDRGDLDRTPDKDLRPDTDNRIDKGRPTIEQPQRSDRPQNNWSEQRSQPREEKPQLERENDSDSRPRNNWSEQRSQPREEKPRLERRDDSDSRPRNNGNISNRSNNNNNSGSMSRPSSPARSENKSNNNSGKRPK